MAGEITLRELSPKLREFIENSGGGGSINANIKTCGFVAEENQTTFTVPFENYVADSCYLDVKVNSIWVSPEEYTINGKEVTFKTALNAGTEVFFTVYLLGATALESVSANVVLENEQKQFVSATEKSKIAEIDVLNEQAIINYGLLQDATDLSTVQGNKIYILNPAHTYVNCPNLYGNFGVLEVIDKASRIYVLNTEVVYYTNNNTYSTINWKQIATIDSVYKKPIEKPDDTDVKDCYETGIYRSYGWVDFPSDCPDGQGVLIVTNWSGDTATGWVRQEFLTPHNKNRYVRSYTGGTVGEWYKVAIASETQDKLPSAYHFDSTQMIMSFPTSLIRFTHSDNQAYIQAGNTDGTNDGVMNLTGNLANPLKALNIYVADDNAKINGKPIATTTKAQLSLLNGWEDFFGTSEPATISRVGNVVTIKACVKGGTYTTGTTIFTVPSDYRPSATQTMLVDVEDSSWAVSRKFITVYADGRCVCNGVHNNIRVTIYISYII